MDLDALRHSCSHIMADAVKRLYPEAKLGIGPAIEDGFYYDFEFPPEVKIKEEDFEKIEKVMRQIVEKDFAFEHETWDKNKALDFMSQRGETYKLELIKELDTEKLSIYKHSEFIDLCKGPHVSSTGKVRHFKLLSTSGAYWRGSEDNAQLTRIYGTVFAKADDLENYLKNLEEARKRDHRKLGKELGLVDIYHNQAGAGLVFYLPKGAILRRMIEDWEVREHLSRGYQMINTPHIMNKNLWNQSGHLDFYKDYMYTVKNKDDQEFILKPMNCPGHILVYKSQLRSWRDLPLRLFELGTVYRYEKSGVLHGLLRVRGFTQDDAHIFCTKDDFYGEIEGVLDFIEAAMNKFGFREYNAELSTRPEGFIGSIKDWDDSERALEEVLKKKEFDYKINRGDGAFYGPKIDIKLKDALGRDWQCATVQLDYNIPKRFDLTYRDSDGSQQRVIMIHRVLLGSLERFIATLIEHYGGAFPFWLSPVQISVLNITEDVKGYASKIKGVFDKWGLRTESDFRSETLQKRIRDKELQKIPYMIIVGKKEESGETISVRKRGMKNLGSMTIEEFIDILKKEEDIGEIC